MAEVAGLVIGTVSMAALVEICTKAFERVESVKTFVDYIPSMEQGRDYEKAVLKLSLLELRLTRWAAGVAQTVKQKNIVIGTSKEAEHVQDLLGDIAATIERAEKTAMRHNTTLSIETQIEDDRDGATFDYLARKVKTMALRRQKTSSFGQRTRWALRDQSKLTRLINDLSDSMNELETVFPPHQMQMIAESRKTLAKAEVMELIRPSEIVEPIDGEVLVSMLEDATHEVDETLNEAVQNEAQNLRTVRHSYGDIKVLDDARILVGDYVAPGETKSGAGHSYKRLVASGNCRVHYGDNFGGKGIFDD